MSFSFGSSRPSVGPASQPGFLFGSTATGIRQAGWGHTSAAQGPQPRQLDHAVKAEQPAAVVHPVPPVPVHADQTALFQAQFTSAQELKDYLIKNPGALDLLRSRKFWAASECNPLLELANITSFPVSSGKTGVGMLTEETVLGMMEMLVEHFNVEVEARDDGCYNGEEQAKIDLKIIHEEDPEPPKTNLYTAFQSYVSHEAPCISSTMVIVDFFLRNGADTTQCANYARQKNREQVAKRISQFGEEGRCIDTCPIRSLKARFLEKPTLKSSLKKAEAVSANIKLCLEEFAEQDRRHKIKRMKHHLQVTNLMGGADYRSAREQDTMKRKLLKMDSELKDLEDLSKTLRRLEFDEINAGKAQLEEVE